MVILCASICNVKQYGSMIRTTYDLYRLNLHRRLTINAYLELIRRSVHIIKTKQTFYFSFFSKAKRLTVFLILTSFINM
jgi:hypothetical protein